MEMTRSHRLQYCIAFAMLLALLLATVAIAGMPLGKWALPACLSIAAMKIAIIARVFMHLGRGATLFGIFGAAGLLTCGLLFVLAGSDYLTRI